TPGEKRGRRWTQENSIMPRFRRPKVPAIYDLVWDWYENDGGVKYVAHAITIAPVVRKLHDELTGDDGGSPQNHPDHRYWDVRYLTAINNAITAAGGVAAIRRIEIDCSLMPCTRKPFGCIFRVPHLLRSC